MMTIILPSKEEPGIPGVLAEIDRLFPEAQTIVSNDRYGNGKGWAIREALPYIQGEIVVFLDGDGDIPPRMINRLLPFLEDYDIVVGKKQPRGHISRRILTRLTRLYVWLMFRVLVDSQTGIKVFLRHAITPWVTDSFSYDIEVLSKAQNRGVSMVEVPVEVTQSRRMKVRSIWISLLDSLKIWQMTRRKAEKRSA